METDDHNFAALAQQQPNRQSQQQQQQTQPSQPFCATSAFGSTAPAPPSNAATSARPAIPTAFPGNGVFAATPTGASTTGFFHNTSANGHSSVGSAGAARSGASTWTAPTTAPPLGGGPPTSTGSALTFGRSPNVATAALLPSPTGTGTSPGSGYAFSSGNANDNGNGNGNGNANDNGNGDGDGNVAAPPSPFQRMEDFWQCLSPDQRAMASGLSITPQAQAAADSSPTGLPGHSSSTAAAAAAAAAGDSHHTPRGHGFPPTHPSSRSKSKTASLSNKKPSAKKKASSKKSANRTGYFREYKRELRKNGPIRKQYKAYKDAGGPLCYTEWRKEKKSVPLRTPQSRPSPQRLFSTDDGAASPASDSVSSLGSRSGSSRRVRDDMAEGFLAATQQRNENRKQSRLQLSEISKTSINSVEKIAERAMKNIMELENDDKMMTKEVFEGCMEDVFVEGGDYGSDDDSGVSDNTASGEEESDDDITAEHGMETANDNGIQQETGTSSTASARLPSSSTGGGMYPRPAAGSATSAAVSRNTSASGAPSQQESTGTASSNSTFGAASNASNGSTFRSAPSPREQERPGPLPAETEDEIESLRRGEAASKATPRKDA